MHLFAQSKSDGIPDTAVLLVWKGGHRSLDGGRWRCSRLLPPKESLKPGLCAIHTAAKWVPDVKLRLGGESKPPFPVEPKPVFVAETQRRENARSNFGHMNVLWSNATNTICWSATKSAVLRWGEKMVNFAPWLKTSLKLPLNIWCLCWGKTPAARLKKN